VGVVRGGDAGAETRDAGAETTEGGAADGESIALNIVADQLTAINGVVIRVGGLPSQVNLASLPRGHTDVALQHESALGGGEIIGVEGAGVDGAGVEGSAIIDIQVVTKV
jgi:hypothetical protein